MVPEHAIETPSCYYWLENGIVHIYNKPRLLHNLEDAVLNIDILDQFVDNKSHPLLIDVTHIKSIERGAREHYAAAGSAKKVKAIALITQSNVSRIVANFFIGFNKPEVPTKLFGDYASAQKWLMTFL